MAIFWDEFLMRNASQTPSVLALGDSWFSHPTPKNSLLEPLGRLIGTTGKHILVKGLSSDSKTGAPQDQHRLALGETLRRYGEGLSAVLLSGLGSDAASLNEFRLLLNLDCSKALHAKECFRTQTQGYSQFLAKVEHGYRALISLAVAYVRTDCPLVMYTYDYPQASGKGVNGGRAWLKTAFDAAKVPLHLQDECLQQMVDDHAAILHKIAGSDLTRFFVIDCRGILNPTEWADELHPTPEGYQLLVKRRWKPLISRLGLYQDRYDEWSSN